MHFVLCQLIRITWHVDVFTSAYLAIIVGLVLHETFCLCVRLTVCVVSKIGSSTFTAGRFNAVSLYTIRQNYELDYLLNANICLFYPNVGQQMMMMMMIR